MMKKTAICTGILLLCSSAIMRADFVSESAAMAVAGEFFSNCGSPCSKSSTNSLKPASTKTFQTKSGAAQPSFHAFNRSGGGYVIISAESSYHPVLAYSMTETFSENSLPDGYRNLLRSLSDDITQVRSSAKPRTKSVASEWENVGLKTKAGLAGKCLETAEWGQGDPYNRQCPMVNGLRCVTGCVATAMAILLRYHRFPTTPESWPLIQYSFDWGFVPQRDLTGRQYNFDSMPLYKEEMQAASEEVKDNVACLMADLGSSVKMNYSPVESGAQSSEVVNALGFYFRYTYDKAFLVRDAYSEEDWTSMIIESIDNDNPIFYTGHNPSGGGHAFVLDGYDSNAMMRFNYGWDGLYHDSFVRLDYDYPVNQTACFNLAPDPDKSHYSPIPYATLYWLPNSPGDVGLSVDEGITRNEDFRLYWSSIINRGPRERGAALRPVLVSGDSRTPIKVANEIPLPTVQLKCDAIEPGSDIVCNISQELKLGDYIEMEYTETDEIRPDLITGWIPLNKPDDGSVVEHYPVIPAFIIDLPSTVTVGEKYRLRLKNGDRAWSYNTDWSYRALDVDGKAKIFSTQSSNWTYVRFDTPGKFEVCATVNNSIGEPADIIVARIEAQ